MVRTSALPTARLSMAPAAARPAPSAAVSASASALRALRRDEDPERLLSHCLTSSHAAHNARGSGDTTSVDCVVRACLLNNLGLCALHLR